MTLPRNVLHLLALISADLLLQSACNLDGRSCSLLRMLHLEMSGHLQTQTDISDHLILRQPHIKYVGAQCQRDNVTRLVRRGTHDGIGVIILRKGQGTREIGNRSKIYIHNPSLLLPILCHMSAVQRDRPAASFGYADNTYLLVSEQGGGTLSRMRIINGEIA